MGLEYDIPQEISISKNRRAQLHGDAGEEGAVRAINLHTL